MSYMTAVLFFGLVWGALFLRYAELRPCILVSSLLFLPAGLVQPLFVPDYWHPAVVYKLWGRFDAESLLFAFFTGGIAPALYPVFRDQRLAPAKRGLKRGVWHLFWLLPLAGAAGLICVGRWVAFPVIYAALIILTIGIIHMLMVRPDLLKAAVWGAVLFCLAYAGVGILTNQLFPQFIPMTWNAAALLDKSFLGIPVEEYIYGVLFGGLWSMVYCGLFNCRFVSISRGAHAENAK